MDLDYIFKIILLNSAIGSLIALLIIAAKKLFHNKIDAVVSYYIWFLLLLRLIIPNGFQMPVKNISIFPAERVQIIQNTQNNSTTININNKIDTTANQKLNNENKFMTINSLKTDGYIKVVEYIWLAGALCLGTAILIINGLTFIRIYKQETCKDDKTTQILEECKSRMGILRKIPIVYEKYIDTPAVFGLIRPKILINRVIAKKLSAEEKRYIFLHELSHLKRKDTITNWIMMILLTINWFNPIIWVSFMKIWEDGEEACDAYVLSYLNETEQKNYGATIINLEKIMLRPQFTIGISRMVSNKSSIKRRIMRIVNYKKTLLKWWLFPICLIIAVVILVTTNVKITAAAKSVNKITVTKQNDKDVKSIINSFLPKGSKILNSNSYNNVVEKDLDNDGETEIVFAYSSSNKNEGKINIMILKKIKNEWIKVLNTKADGFAIDSVLAADIDNDGENEVLLGKRVGGTLGELSIYKWKSKKLIKIAKEDVPYSKFDIVRLDDGNAGIARWTHDTGEAYAIDILKWNGIALTSSASNCEDYFKNTVVQYYKNKTGEMPNAAFYWYYLADGQIRAGQKKDAAASISKGLSVSADEYFKTKLLELQKEASK